MVTPERTKTITATTMPEIAAKMIRNQSSSENLPKPAGVRRDSKKFLIQSPAAASAATATKIGTRIGGILAMRSAIQWNTGERNSRTGHANQPMTANRRTVRSQNVPG